MKNCANNNFALLSKGASELTLLLYYSFKFYLPCPTLLRIASVMLARHLERFQIAIIEAISIDKFRMAISTERRATRDESLRISRIARPAKV
jgi:uncharacterized protein (DUF2384 family)